MADKAPNFVHVVPPPPKSALLRHRQLAPTANVRVSPLCLGTMGFGEAFAGFMGDTSKKTAFEILDAFVAAGGNFLDTANNYVRRFQSHFLSIDGSGVKNTLFEALLDSQQLLTLDKS
jgi:hypothetical protein